MPSAPHLGGLDLERNPWVSQLCLNAFNYLEKKQQHFYRKPFLGELCDGYNTPGWTRGPLPGLHVGRARVAQEGALERNAAESKVPEAGEGWYPPKMHEKTCPGISFHIQKLGARPEVSLHLLEVQMKKKSRFSAIKIGHI